MGFSVIHVDAQLHARFKAWCDKRDVPMKVALEELLRGALQDAQGVEQRWPQIVGALKRYHEVCVVTTEALSLEPWTLPPFWER